ncbi:MAG: penicillin-binding protein 2 [Chloroflexi bacterium]|nr:penicillin-binding protein 2 [Chloroflexota bacterium]
MSVDEQIVGQRRRIAWLGAVMAVAGLVLLVRLVGWQLFRHDEVMMLVGQGQSSRIAAARGNIYDATGHLVVASSVQYDLGVSPSLLSDEDKVIYAPLLAATLSLSPQHAITPTLMLETLRKNVTYVQLAKQLPAEVGQAIEYLEDSGQMRLDAFRLELSASRVYPDASLAAHVVGWLQLETHDEDARTSAGFYGLEEQYDAELRGKDGTWQRISDRYGKPVMASLENYQPARDGVDLALTIDRNIQYEAERVLREGVSAMQATLGTLIVVDPHTGGVLAIANEPTFAPGEYAAVTSNEVYVNGAVSSLFTPGTSFQPLTLALALNSRVIRADETYDDRGELTVGRQQVTNADREAHGLTTWPKMLAGSYNVGAAHVAVLLGPTRFYEGLRSLGFGAKTDIDLPHEAPGIMWVPTDSLWNLFYLATNSFGKDISTTPLQVTMAYAALANDGLLMRPYVVSQLREQGQVYTRQPITVRRVLTAEVAREISRILAESTQLGPEEARVPGYSLAGKTGTAPAPDRIAPEHMYSMVSYVGYGPVPDARFVVFVKFEKPRQTMWLEDAAAPAFSRMAQYLLDYYGIPPQTSAS